MVLSVTLESNLSDISTHSSYSLDTFTSFQFTGPNNMKNHFQFCVFAKISTLLSTGFLHLQTYFGVKRTKLSRWTFLDRESKCRLSLLE